jgi:hypothetical protein
VSISLVNRDVEFKIRSLRRAGNDLRSIASICGVSETVVHDVASDEYEQYRSELNQMLHNRAKTSDQVLIKLAQRHKLLDPEVTVDVNVTVDVLSALQTAISQRYSVINELADTRRADRESASSKRLAVIDSQIDRELDNYLDSQYVVE